MMIDQALSSAGNFAFALFALRNFDLDIFGAVSYGLLLYTLLLAVQRNILSEPFLVRATAGPAGFLATSVAQGAVPAVVGVLALPLQGHVSTVALFGVVFPVLAHQDAARYVAFRAGRIWHAVASDGTWLVVVGGLWVLPVGALSAQVLVLVWASGAGLGLIVHAFLDRNATRLSFADSRRCQQILWARGRSFLTDFAVERGMSHLVFLLLILFGGFSALGTFNGARTLLGPLNVVFLALPPMRMTTLSREHPGAGPVRRLAIDSAFLALTAALLGTVLFAIRPAWLGVIVGPNVTEVRQVLPAVTLFTIALALAIGAQLGMKVFATGRELVLTRLASVVPSIAIAIPWLATASVGRHAMIAALSLAAGNLVGGALWWHRLFRLSGSPSLRMILPASPFPVRRS